MLMKIYFSQHDGSGTPQHRRLQDDESAIEDPDESAHEDLDKIASGETDGDEEPAPSGDSDDSVREGSDESAGEGDEEPAPSEDAEAAEGGDAEWVEPDLESAGSAGRAYPSIHHVYRAYTSTCCSAVRLCRVS